MSRRALTASEADARIDRRTMALAGVLVGFVFSFGASYQSSFVFDRPPLELHGIELDPAVEFVLKVCVNMTAVVGITWLAMVLRLYDRRPLVIAACVVPAVLAGLVPRTLLQLALGLHRFDGPVSLLRDAAVTGFVGVFVVVCAIVVTRLSRQVRETERARQLAATRAVEALGDLQQEELRVRRDVADTLHGTMQQRLVMFRATLDSAVEELGAPLSPEASEQLRDRLRALRDELDRMRETELRALSTTLYPEGLDRGLVPAVRALTARIPPSIAVRFDVDSVPTRDSLDQQERLLLVRIAEEGVSNALRHGEASEIEVRLHLDESTPQPRIVLGVRSIGVVPPPDAAMSGLARLRSRLEDRGGSLELRPEPDGATLLAELAVG